MKDTKAVASALLSSKLFALSSLLFAIFLCLGGVTLANAERLQIANQHYLKYGDKYVALFGLGNFWTLGDSATNYRDMIETFARDGSNLIRMSIVCTPIRYEGLEPKNILYPWARTDVPFLPQGGQVTLQLNGSGTLPYRWYQIERGRFLPPSLIGFDTPSATQPKDLGKTRTIEPPFSGMAALHIGRPVGVKGENWIGKWQMYEIEFSNPSYRRNPFDIELSAAFTHLSSGEKLSIRGFYDGDDTWKVRFMPNRLGTWKWVTSSEDEDLNGHQGDLECVESGELGVGIFGSMEPKIQQVDETYPNKFRWADGGYFLWNGNTCKNLLGADKSHPKAGGWKDFIDYTAEMRMNNILFFLYAPTIRTSSSAALGMAPWSLVAENPPSHAFNSRGKLDYFWVPWAKKGAPEQEPKRPEEVDFTRFSISYWEHVDEVLSYMYQKEIIAHIFFYPDDAFWPKEGEEEERYIRYALARLSAYPHIVWNTGVDLGEYRSTTDWVRYWGRLLKEGDPYNHPRSSRHFGDDRFSEPLLTWASTQSRNASYEEWKEMMSHNKPVTEDDGTYEPKRFDADGVRKRAWLATIADGVGLTYGNQWGQGMSFHRLREDDAGAEYNRIRMEFLSRIDWWKLTPHDELVSEGYCIAQPGQEYLIYLPSGKSVELDLSNVSGSFRAMWLSPCSGERIEVKSVFGGGRRQLEKPESLHSEDAVLYLCLWAE